MKRIPRNMLTRMAEGLPPDDRDELAIPSYLHPNPLMRWMAWRRVEVVSVFLKAACDRWRGDEEPVVMDFGCGTGVLFDEASRCAQKIYGVDVVLGPARHLVDEWELGKVILLTPEQAMMRIPEKSIDIILAAEVLEHVDPVEDTLTFFRERLKPGGVLLVSLPTEGWLYRIGRRLAGFDGKYHHSNASWVHRRVLDAGFKTARLKKIPAPGSLAIYWVIDYRAP